jgi:hypothetical protein
MDNYCPAQNMMVSSTPCCKSTDKRSRITPFKLFLLTLPLLIACLVFAASSSLHIKSAELVAAEEAFVLNADFDVTFSNEVEAALNKGVPLSFLVEFQLVTPRRYWFDDEIETSSMEITLGYHALSRQYLLNRNNHQQAFTSLQEAKEELARLRDWRVIDKTLLKKGEVYHAGLRIRLDQSKLPKPLQVDVIGSESWNMVSQRYRWTPALAL